MGITAQRVLGGMGLTGAAGVLALLFWALSRPATGSSGIGVNAAGAAVVLTPQPAVDVTLQLFDAAGTRWHLGDQRGRTVILNFWASWCAPCRTEAGVLAQAARDYGPRNITLVGINLWDDPAAARPFLTEFGITYPNGSDPSRTAGVAYGVTGIPETFVINAAGQLTQRWIGPVTRTDLDALVKASPAR